MMKAARLLLIGLIALGSQACAAPERPLARCAVPLKPDLPLFNPEFPFDHLSNVEILLKRDDYMRQYAHGLEDTARCYEMQLGDAK